MDGLTLEFLFLASIQCSLLLFFSTYVLDLSWTNKQLLMVIVTMFLPTILLSNFVGAIAIFYFILVLAMMVYNETKSIMSIFLVIVGLILSVISDNLTYIISRYFFQSHEHLLKFSNYTLYIIVTLLFAFCFKRIVNYYLNRWAFHRFISYLLVFLGFATVIFIYINIMAIDYDNFYESVKYNLTLFLIYIVFLSISVCVIVYLTFKQYQIKQREQEMQNFDAYIASLEQINQDMRKFKHDYVNILSSLRTFIDDKNYEGLHTYFYQYILNANHHEQLNQQAMMALNRLKINSLKGLFTTKILQAQSHHVPFYIEVVEEISDVPVNLITLNRMVGILLDNAIEAATEIENGEVRVAIIDIDEAILIVVSNTFNDKASIKVHEIYQEGFSTKGENRGLGLANLRQLKKGLVNVDLNTKIHPPYFIQELAFRKE